MTIKNAKKALDAIYKTSVHMVTDYNHDEHEEYRTMVHKMDGVITCVIWCTDGDQYNKVQEHGFELQSKFYDEVRGKA